VAKQVIRIAKGGLERRGHDEATFLSRLEVIADTGLTQVSWWLVGWLAGDMWGTMAPSSGCAFSRYITGGAQRGLFARLCVCLLVYAAAFWLHVHEGVQAGNALVCLHHLAARQYACCAS
jgi:hypothetical protein